MGFKKMEKFRVNSGPRSTSNTAALNATSFDEGDLKRVALHQTPDYESESVLQLPEPFAFAPSQLSLLGSDVPIHPGWGEGFAS